MKGKSLCPCLFILSFYFFTSLVVSGLFFGVRDLRHMSVSVSFLLYICFMIKSNVLFSVPISISNN